MNNQQPSQFAKPKNYLYRLLNYNLYAGMLEQADNEVLEASAFQRTGSNPVTCTNLKMNVFICVTKKSNFEIRKEQEKEMNGRCKKQAQAKEEGSTTIERVNIEHCLNYKF